MCWSSVVIRLIVPPPDRDGVRLKMIPEELEKRKALLWNMMNVDVRLVSDLFSVPCLSIG